MRSTLISTLSALALALTGVTGLTACTGGEDDIEEEAELDEGSDDAKNDQADLQITELDVGGPLNNTTRKVGVIKSKSAYKDAFGVNPPSSVNFSTHWVVYYNAGAKTSGGYDASIKRIRLSDTGKTLKVTAHLQVPGPTCLTTAAITFPYAVVKVRKQASVTSNRYYQEQSVTDCNTAFCSGQNVSVPGYLPIEGSADPRVACRIDEDHCITSDHDACPQIHPLPPTFCQQGTVETVPHFIPSADGLECSLPSKHCVTNNQSACPQFDAPPPCPQGTILETEPHYIASSDGMECRIPNLHCVTTNPASCPI